MPIINVLSINIENIIFPLKFSIFTAEKKKNHGQVFIMYLSSVITYIHEDQAINFS